MFYTAEIAHAVQKTDVQVAVHISPLDAIFSAGIVVQITLAILVSMSIGCWAIFLSKRRTLNLMEDANDAFLEEFWRATSLEAIYDRLPRFKDSAMARVFRAGFLELRKMAESPLMKNSDSTQLLDLENLERSLRKATDQELQLMEARLNWLATTGSTGPFIGLFGTVWGIMGAFQKIGQTGAASLAVVAPGISEALVATAIGLAAAIPAVIVYNYFVGRIRRNEIEINNFSADLLNMTRRNFTAE